MKGALQIVLDAFKAIGMTLAASKLPWLGGPSFHPEAFSPIMCTLAAMESLRSHGSPAAVAFVKPDIEKVALHVLQASVGKSLHSSLDRYFQAFSSDSPAPAPLC